MKRQHLLGALSAPTRVVTLVGPIGSGRTTLLRQWAADLPSVSWAVRDSIPATPADVLVIDDADTLSEADWEQIQTLLHRHPHLQIRAASHRRSAVPGALAAEFISELSFTVQETSEYLSARGSHLDAKAIHLATDGLPAAVHAVARLNALRPERVREVLAELPPGAMDAHSAVLAIPEVLTSQLVAELGGPAGFLENAEAAGWGAWTEDPGQTVFVLSAPVRAATMRAHPHDDVQAIREQAARVLLAEEAWYGALREGVAIGSLAVVDAALKGGGMTFIRMRGVPVSAALRDVRVMELRRWPVIAMAQALMYNARHEHRLRAVELMGIALIGARTSPAGSAERALLRVIESVAKRLLGLGDGGLKAARAAAQILAELPTEERRTIDGLIEDLHTHAAISLMYGGQDEEALEEFALALAAARRPGIRLISLGGAAMIHALAGDLIAAQDWVHTALAQSWAESILNEYQGSLLRIAEAKIALEHDELERADAALTSVWHIIDTIEHWPTLAHLRAMLDISRGEPEVGLERLRSLRRRRGSRAPRSQMRLLDATESSLALAAGDVATARKLTSRAGDLPIVTIGIARVELFDGQHERALRTLASIPASAPEDRAHVAALEAVVLNRLGRGTDAATAARRARAITDAYGLRTPFLLLPADDRELFGVVVSDRAPVLTARDAAPRLTERERVILAEMLHTASVNDIAARLHVSVNTVKSQRRSLYRKLDASTREEALAIATGHGLIAGDAAVARQPR